MSDQKTVTLTEDEAVEAYLLLRNYRTTATLVASYLRDTPLANQCLQFAERCSILAETIRNKIPEGAKP